jgi:AraC-like DNA-binding protein
VRRAAGPDTELVLRLEQAEKARLVSERLHREGIGFDCGFSSKSALNSNFKKRVGMTPTEFRRREPSPGGVTAEQRAPTCEPPTLPDA